MEKKKTRNYLATVNQAVALLTLMVFVQAQVVLAQQPIQTTAARPDSRPKGKMIGRCLQPAQDPDGKLYGAFKACMQAQRAEASPDAGEQIGSYNPSQAALSAAASTPADRAVRVRQVPATAPTLAPKTVTLTDKGVEVTWPMPANPNDFTQEVQAEILSITKKAACMDDKVQQEYKGVIDSSPRIHQVMLARARAWYSKYKNQACQKANVSSSETTMTVVTDPNWYKSDQSYEHWNVVDNDYLRKHTTRETAGLYGGFTTARTPAEFKDMLDELMADKDRSEKLEGYLRGVRDQKLTQAQMDEFIQKLHNGEYTVEPMAAAYYANYGRQGIVSENFAYVPKPAEKPFLVARVRLDNADSSGYFYMDLLQVCLNGAPPVTMSQFRAEGDNFVVNAGKPPVTTDWPHISLTKRVNKTATGSFKLTETVFAQQNESSVFFLLTFRNAGPTTSTGNVLCDPAVPGRIPADSIAQELASPQCMKLPDVLPGMEEVRRAEYKVDTTLKVVTTITNTATATNSNQQKVQDRAFVTFVPAPPPPTVITVPAPPTSCAPSCFGLLSTTARYAVPQGQPVDIYVSPDLPNSGQTKVLRATVSLDETGDDGKKQKEVKIGHGASSKTLKVGEVLSFEMFRQPAGDVREFLESPELTPGYYTLQVTFSINGTLMVCPMKVWVPKKGMSKWVPVLTFVGGVAVGFGLSYFIGGATHISTIVGTKPVGTALQSITNGIRPIIPIP